MTTPPPGGTGYAGYSGPHGQRGTHGQYGTRDGALPRAARTATRTPGGVR